MAYRDNQLLERELSGVEVEFLARPGSTHSGLCRKLVATLGREWETRGVHSFGLRGDNRTCRIEPEFISGMESGWLPCELKTPKLQVHEISQLRVVLRALRSLGCKSDATSAEVGVHVHVDAAGFDGSQAKRLLLLHQSVQSRGERRTGG